MRSYSWQKPLLSALAVGISLAMSPSSHAADWKPGVPRSAYVTLFEWDWDSVAKECKNFLGPKGYSAVQVSPPQEHPTGSEWWQRYQPVSYKIASRGGDRTRFKAMVDGCKAAGVDVYVDTVINHMANYFGGTGSGGSTWSARSFPAVPFGTTDFHQPKCDIAPADYNEKERRANVVNCDMPGLPDLDTSKENVRQKIADYLNDLRTLGVAGFRIDAAKHITPTDLAAIKAKVPGAYFFTQEVIRDGSVGDDMAGYLQLGTVNEFNYIYAMKNAFLNLYSFSPSKLPEAFTSWGNVASDKATVFVNNHDTERKLCTNYTPGSGVCDSLNTLNGVKLYLANVFMLAYNYGYPSVASGYYFKDHDMGPPAAQPYSGSETAPANCSSTVTIGKWDCVHRDRRVANMVGFRNYVSGSSVSNWVSGDVNQIAFSRTGKGFVAINSSSQTWQQTFTTGLPDGKYCNVVASNTPESGVCPIDTQVNVSGGQATLSVAPNAAVALHVGAKAVEPVCNNPTDFAFPDATNVAPGTTVKSNVVTVNGISCDTPVSISGGSYSINGGAFTTTSGVIRNGQTLQVQVAVPANATPGTPIVANVTVGTDTRTFKAYPASACDTDPTDFTFPDVTNVAPGTTVTSNVVTVSGISCDTPISISGGAYRINSGTFTTAAGVIRNGQTLQLRLSVPSSAAAGSITSSTVKVGSDTRAFRAITATQAACANGAPVCTVPSLPVAGKPVTVYYKGSLAGSTSLKLHWGINGWQANVADAAMTKRADGYFETTVNLPACSSEFDYVFTNGSAWDNNAGKDYKVAVSGTNCGPVTVTFKVNATTIWGESVYITGNQAELGNWSSAQDASRKCEPTAYPVWTCTIAFPAGGKPIQYKFLKLGMGTKWESGANRLYTVPMSDATKDDGYFRN